jgi:hypothetical protein
VALYLVKQNTTSDAQDLNQLVELLNGTDTSTVMTVANRVSAQMTGATAASAYAGGVTTGSGPPSGAWSTGDVLVDSAGLLWVNTASGWYPVGRGGYTARVHQRWIYQSLNRERGTLILLDTVDFDPRGMWSKSRRGFVVPRTGRWRVKGRIGISGPSSGAYARAAPLIYINGLELLRGDDAFIPTDDGGLSAEGVMALNTGDLVQLWSFLSFGGASTTEAHMSLTWEG